MDKWERMHRSNLALYQRRIMAIYEAATKEAAAIGTSIDRPLGEELFDFNKFPTAQKRIDELMKKMYAQTRTVIVNGVRSEWTLANNKNNELCRMVFGDNVGKLTQAEYRRYFSNNLEARDAFIERKENGLDLSDRVWEYTNMYKNELELGLDVGIRNGRSADELSRDLRDYLQHPDKLFRRVRDEHGMLVLSAAAKAFHPGRGVYRSSYMNARRLSATETNIAYRTADYNRYQQLDFVVGIEVHLSNNHNCKGIPAGQFYDICDELQGKYPKEFKFVGWHPFCRCYVTSILKTEKEMDEDDARIMRGEEPTENSVNTVTTVPEGFTKWVEDNSDRISRAKSLPYFLRDNGEIVEGLIQTAPAKSAQATIGKTKYVPHELRRGGDYFNMNEEVDEDLFRLLKEDPKYVVKQSDSGSECTDDGKVITLADKSRWEASPYFKKAVVYHETGHAVDFQRGLSSDKDLIDMRKKHLAELSKVEKRTWREFGLDENLKFTVKEVGEREINMFEYVENELDILRKLLQTKGEDWLSGTEYGVLGYNIADVDEQILNLRDTIKSLNTKYGTGHDNLYFSGAGHKETEYIAHCFENAFVGNKIFETYLPDIYKDMVDFVRKLPRVR